MQRIAHAIYNATPDTHILVGDETNFSNLPLLRAAWMRIAKQVRVPTPEDNLYSVSLAC